MATCLDAIALGHLNQIVQDNGLGGAVFLQCAQEDLQAIGIGQVQWDKIRMYVPQWQAGRWRRCLASPAVGGAALPAQPLAVLLDVGGATTGRGALELLGPVRPRGLTTQHV